MRFISNVAGWTQLTQLFDFLSFFGDGMIDICDITFALYTFSHEYLWPKATQFWVAYWGKKKEESRCPNMRCYRGYSPLEDYEICTAALQKHSFYRKNQKFFGIRTVVVYFVSSFFFIPMLTIFFTRVFPLFWPLFAFYNRQNQSFFYGSLLSQQSFPPFLEIFFSLKSNDHVNITTTLMLHICYCALCISTVFEKSLKSLI